METSIPMFQIAICDAIPEHAAQLRHFILESHAVDPCVVECFSSAAALEQRVLSSYSFDIAFLDIEIGTESGIALAQSLNRISPTTQIVFVSAYLSHAVDIFHVYFLTKPIDRSRLLLALDKAKTRVRNSRESSILLPVRCNATVVLALSQILYFERMRRTTIANCIGMRHETALKLAALEEILPAELFSRPHNSYLVNLAHVRKIERFCLHLESGEILPISNRHRSVFRDDLTNYIQG